MATHLDLQEQEQLDQLKHFWKQYGNAITWLLIVAFGTVAGWNGWQWWQRDQAAKAAAAFDQMEAAATLGAVPMVEAGLKTLQERMGRTAYAQYGGLMAGRLLWERGKSDEARSALSWVIDTTEDDGVRAVARLRLAAMYADDKAWDKALSQLDGRFPEPFRGLVADRRGDILLLQGKKSEARAEYEKALKGLEGSGEYRRLVEAKLTALGGSTAAAS